MVLSFFKYSSNVFHNYFITVIARLELASTQIGAMTLIDTQSLFKFDDRNTRQKKRTSTYVLSSVQNCNRSIA